MNLKGKKNILIMTAALALSLGIMGCNRDNTNPPGPGTNNRNNSTITDPNNTNGRNQTSLNGTGQDHSGVNLNDGKGTNLMGLNPDGTTAENNTGNNTGFNTNDRLNTSIGNTQRNTTGLNEGFQESTVRDDYQNGNNNTVQRADRIERAIVGSVAGVKGARVIINNNRALVGVDMGAGVTGNATTTLRNNVERAVRAADPTITNVAVSADPDIFRRITNVGNGIRNGRPFSQFGNEVEEIFNRVTPR